MQPLINTAEDPQLVKKTNCRSRDVLQFFRSIDKNGVS